MNRMRGMLEDEMAEKRAQKLKEMQLENKRLALEKKQREHKWKVEQQHLNEKEIADPNYTWAIILQSDAYNLHLDLKLRQWNFEKQQKGRVLASLLGGGVASCT